MDAPSISVVECAPRLFAYVRRQATLKSMPAVAAASPVWSAVFERRIKTTDRPVNVFIDASGDALFRDTGFLTDMGVEILERFDDDLTMRCGETPSGRAATAWFKGPYSEIDAVHRAIRAWCAGHGHSLAGPVWEICTWNEDPALLETQLHYLLA
jgi:effector-binding domain-containing protein